MLIVHDNFKLCPIVPHFTDLFFQFTKNTAVKKCLSYVLIYAVYLEYIVTCNFVRPYPFLLTLYVQYTKNSDNKQWLPFELKFAVYLVYIVTSNFVRP